jgi:hydrogenase maturation protein HypF
MADHGERIRVRGLVQGVGFRPTVWRLARQFELRGDVINDGDGVLIRAWAQGPVLDRFCEALAEACPPLARIDSIERRPLAQAAPAEPGFVIAPSRATEVRTGVVADAATCPACRAEIFEPTNRRYRYPFTNCTHCGPRLSIVRSIPYDRANTSMAQFTQCTDCQAEYDDPADRRFHAQPNACPKCGPRVWLCDASGREISATDAGHRDPIAHTAALLAEGGIVAVKGIGGFHLVCDASDAGAVQRLRERKRRYAKPFALMADSAETIARYAEIDEPSRQLLRDPAAPIVLLRQLRNTPELAPGIAPGQDHLGFMLPYSPLHHILLSDWAGLRPGAPLVMTSGNLSEEPQCTDNADAGERLADIADFRLLHDRDIVNRVDDSVARVDAGVARLLRRARGYAPTPLPLPPGFEQAPPLLALGGELKNTFCLLHDGQAVVSQHLGDLEDARTSDAWEHALSLYRALYRHQPEAVVVDAHPDYRSTRFGRAMAHETGLTLIEVQHHHAHIAAVMGDSAYARDRGPVLGIALDGLGMGSDATLWGGEFLVARYGEFERLGHLPSTPLPGGTQALIEPWRNTWAQLVTQLGWDTVTGRWGDLDAIRWLETKPLKILAQMVERQVNSPLSSGCGRLFDAVAGLLGICRERLAYEGQAAIELEVLSRTAGDETRSYPIDLTAPTPTLAPLWTAMLDDLADGIDRATVAARFHNGLADAIVRAAGHWCRLNGLQDVALSGGVFQNRRLFEEVERGIRHLGLDLLTHRQVPTNDGCIALGQALIAADRLLGPVNTMRMPSVGPEIRSD